MIIDREVANFIRKANREELVTIINLVKERQKTLPREESRSFKVGDKVEFDAGRRGLVTGEIIKINPKTIRVKQTNGFGMTWKVSPMYLKKSA